ncbi:GmrSD restriction endonuclease domain-containing protein [Dermacoccus nishinomiyaensis]|uniref:GmrSD restriction endonuclease domain-containing protein n=1 Tax=Dermacoccus nishinomiyaensis TaxID=1274 RepID=UPI001EF5923D|nr:DUF262 domain-containing protein [Dermacoccus nishinomiyaensis]MCG7429844.1 DUF262 domain-containing protein [Dermacoccus nishinomiyaensis]
MAKYSVEHRDVETLLNLVKAEQIAIPELQRPFVWDSVKVRDLMDSLYKGYPVGYLITWQSIGAKLKGGQVATHQQILIDGQQRITALRAAVAGLKVIDKKYRQKRITIAFNPVSEEFATLTPVIDRNPEWVSDVAEFFDGSPLKFVRQYLAANPDADPDVVEENLEHLASIKHAQIGIISLSDDLDVETVSEIFIRINSKGVPLSSADFAMSKIATYGDRGRNLRKLIDYFAHLSVAPHAYDDIKENDVEFGASGYLEKIAWLRNVSEDLYDPNYGDIIRVAGLVGFSRGRASSIVGELSGRDPETRKLDPDRIPRAYDVLEAALAKIVNQYEFENFVMTIKSAGFITPSMIGSKNALNFAYALYLRLRQDASMSEGERKRIVRRWFVMSMLTGRHSGSFETTWELDMRRIASMGAAAYLTQLEESTLSDAYWNVTMPSALQTPSTSAPAFQAFLASQIHANKRGFLSRSITVTAMHENSGDIHHIVPKAYLQAHGVTDRRDYNQVANFALTETSVNISIGKRSPAEYMGMVDEQIATGVLKLGELTDADDLARNLAENAIPANIRDVSVDDYESFLAERRQLMAQAVRLYYEGL